MIVALCGGIGSGKSAVAEILRGLGAHTLSADSINAELLKDPAYLVKLRKLFPEAFVAGDEPDKKKIREIIFSDEERRKSLNGLAHGEIMAEIARRAEGKELVFVEIPLLAEAGAKKSADKICYVRAPREARVRRITERDGVSRAEAEAALDAQRGEEALECAADYILDNSEGFTELASAVEKMYRECSTK